MSDRNRRALPLTRTITSTEVSILVMALDGRTGQRTVNTPFMPASAWPGTVQR